MLKLQFVDTQWKADKWHTDFTIWDNVSHFKLAFAFMQR